LIQISIRTLKKLKGLGEIRILVLEQKLELDQNILFLNYKKVGNINCLNVLRKFGKKIIDVKSKRHLDIKGIS
jgi:hypothetical protein